MDKPAQSSGSSSLLGRFLKQASPGSLALINSVRSGSSKLLTQSVSEPVPSPTSAAITEDQDIDQKLAHQLSINLSRPDSQTLSQPVVVTQTRVNQISDSKKLDILDQVIDEVESISSASVLDSVLPQVALQASDTLNPQAGITTAKEKTEAQAVIEAPADVGGSTQVELEKTPELPVEVEQYLEHVENNADQLPQEIVVTGDDIAIQPSHRPMTPVVVLPISPDDEKEAQFKGPSWSIRWLIEWSHKIIKKFVGKVIYRRDSTEKSE